MVHALQIILPLDREQLSVHQLVVRLSDGIAPYPCRFTVHAMRWDVERYTRERRRERAL